MLFEYASLTRIHFIPHPSIYDKKDTTELTPDATDLNNNHTGPDTILLSDVQPETVVKDLLPEQDQTTVFIMYLYF